MSNPLIYIDQNILTHADNAEIAKAFHRIRQSNALTAISHVHLIEICRSSDPSKFIKRIEALQPALLRSREADDQPSYAREIIVDFDPEKLINEYFQEYAKVHFSLIQAHLPLLKMFGGLEDISSDDLLQIYLGRLEGTVTDLLPMMNPFERIDLQMQLSASTAKITKDWKSIDFQDARSKSDAIRKRIRADGKLHQIPSQELVVYVRQIAELEEPLIFSDYPKDFAQKCENTFVMLSTFSMLLYLIGAIPKTGKLFRGDPTDQENVLFGQILDNYHIGEAAVANAFLTCDALAARLASSVYAYAGVGTKVWLMKSPENVNSSP